MNNSYPHIFPTEEEWNSAFESTSEGFIRVPIETAFQTTKIYVTMIWLTSWYELALNASDFNRLKLFLQQVASGTAAGLDVQYAYEPEVQRWIATPLVGLSVTWGQTFPVSPSGGLGTESVPVFMTLTQSQERRAIDAQGEPATADWTRDVARILRGD